MHWFQNLQNQTWWTLLSLSHLLSAFNQCPLGLFQSLPMHWFQNLQNHERATEISETQGQKRKGDEAVEVVPILPKRRCWRAWKTWTWKQRLNHAKQEWATNWRNMQETDIIQSCPTYAQKAIVKRGCQDTWKEKREFKAVKVLPGFLVSCSELDASCSYIFEISSFHLQVFFTVITCSLWHMFCQILHRFYKISSG